MPKRGRSRKFQKGDWGRYRATIIARVTPSMKEKLRKHELTESGAVRAALAKYLK